MRRYMAIWMTGAVAAVALGGCEEIPCPEAIPGRVESEITAPFDARAWDICAASGGGFVVAGYASGQPFSPVASATYERSLDSFVVMLDASGNIEWSRTFGGDGADEVRNIEPAGDGGYIVAGNKGASPLDPVFFTIRQASRGQAGLPGERAVDRGTGNRSLHGGVWALRKCRRGASSWRGHTRR